MNTKRLLLILVAVIAAACATAPQPQPPLRVMTYNIRLDLASDGDNAWPHRKNAVAALIGSSAADLVGLQEALPAQLDDLALLLPQFARVGTGRDADLRGEASAILYRKERFELLHDETFWLSETPQVAGSRGWDAAYPRIVTWAELRDRETGQRFFHVNTHLDHVGIVARREGTRLLLQRLDDFTAGDDVVILTGDFNATPDDEPYQFVTAAGFRDARELAEERTGPDSTWNAFNAVEPGRRIDFIFIRGACAVLRHTILDETLHDGRFASDHFPVFAEIDTSVGGIAGGVQFAGRMLAGAHSVRPYRLRQDE